jgi:acyl carrier protein
MIRADALQVIDRSAANLRNAGVIDEGVVIDTNTVLFGSRAAFDSLGFVALISEIEEQLSRTLNRDVYLLVDEIHQFGGEGRTYLSAGALADYIEHLTRDSGT